MKKDANWNSYGAFSSVLLTQGANFYFLQAFLNNTNSLWGEYYTLYNCGFLIKEDFRCGVSILDFTGFNVCITFIRIQNFLA